MINKKIDKTLYKIERKWLKIFKIIYVKERIPF